MSSGRLVGHGRADEREIGVLSLTGHVSGYLARWERAAFLGTPRAAARLISQRPPPTGATRGRCAPLPDF